MKIEISEETWDKIKSQVRAEEGTSVIEDMDDLVGERYLFNCARYFYHGTVKKVTATYIELGDAGIVFDTGSYTDNKPSDRQELPNNVYVMRGAIESFTKMKW